MTIIRKEEKSKKNIDIYRESLENTIPRSINLG